jgi:hypothetical protein
MSAFHWMMLSPCTATEVRNRVGSTLGQALAGEVDRARRRYERAIQRGETAEARVIYQTVHAAAAAWIAGTVNALDRLRPRPEMPEPVRHGLKAVCARIAPHLPKEATLLEVRHGA